MQLFINRLIEYTYAPVVDAFQTSILSSSMTHLILINDPGSKLLGVTERQGCDRILHETLVGRRFHCCTSTPEWQRLQQPRLYGMNCCPW